MAGDGREPEAPRLQVSPQPFAQGLADADPLEIGQDDGAVLAPDAGAADQRHAVGEGHGHLVPRGTLLSLVAGACQLTEDSFHPLGTLDVIGQGTVFMAVPTIYYRLLEQLGFRAAARTWRDLRLCTCGSAPIRPDVLPELEGILGRPVTAHARPCQ